MVKDFNSYDFTLDYSFTINVDTAVMVFKDFIKESGNPATNKFITDYDNYNGSINIFQIKYREQQISTNNGNKF